MLHKIILITLSLFVLSVAQAQNLEINPDSPDQYVVVEGDTLWDISGRFLSEPWRWPEIWEVNPQINDPHLIYPGDIVSLTYRDGLPVLSVNRGGVAGGSTSGRSTSGRAVRLSPEIREYEREDAITTIPMEAIRHFLERPMVINDDDEMDSWPYVVSSPQQRLISGQGNRIYVMGIVDNGQESYSIFRKGKAYEKNGETLGYEALHLGDAVIEKHGSPATLLITDSTREVMNGDRLMAQSRDDISSDFIPNPVTDPVQGSIISVIDGLYDIGGNQIVVIDVGSNDGIEVGDLLGVYQDGGVLMDKTGVENTSIIPNREYAKWLGEPKAKGNPVNLPNEYAGIVMVFRIYNRVSYGIIMEAYGPLHLDDIVSNL